MFGRTLIDEPEFGVDRANLPVDIGFVHAYVIFFGHSRIHRIEVTELRRDGLAGKYG
ncbi:hypothetical protein AB4Z21_22590 [Paenibacillus sp. MCAF20]